LKNDQSNTQTIHTHLLIMNETELEALEVMETIEDSVEYICNEYMLSGEKVWTMIAALADAKIAQFPD